MKTPTFSRSLTLFLSLLLLLGSTAQAQNSKLEKPIILMIHGLAGNDLKWKELIEYLPVDEYEYLGNFDIDRLVAGKVEDYKENPNIFVAPSNSNNNPYKIFTLYFHNNTGLNFTEQGIRTRKVVDKLVKEFNQDVVLVAHSMGGLAARACLMQNPANIVGLVTATTPHVGSYCGLVSEYYEKNKLNLSQDENDKIKQFVQLAGSTATLSVSNQKFIESYAVYWNDIEYINGMSVLDKLTDAVQSPLNTFNAEILNFLLSILHDKLEFSSPAVKYLIPYSEEMKELYEQEISKDLPIGVVLSKWDEDLYQEVNQSSLNLMNHFFSPLTGLQIRKASIKSITTDMGRNAISMIPEALQNKYTSVDQNNYPGDGKYFDYTDGIVTVFSQDIRNGIANGAEIKNIGYFGTNLFHTGVPRDCPTMQNAIEFVLNSIGPKKNSVKVGLILDSSGSMQDSDPDDVRKTAAEAIIDILKDEDEAFIVDFDNISRFKNMGQTKIGTSPDLKRYIREIDSNGGTNIGLGLSTMSKAILTGEGLDFNTTGVILLTDGQGDYNNEATWYIQNNIPIYTVSYMQYADAALMSNIADQTGGVYVQANNKDDVVHAFTQFYYGISGKSTIFRDEVTTESFYETGSFYVDESATEMVIYLAGLNIDPSLIQMTFPDNRSMMLSQVPDLVQADNYLFARVPKNQTGNYSISVTPWITMENHPQNLWSNSTGGPSGIDMATPGPVSFIIEVSTDTKLEVAANVKDSKNGYFEVNFQADEKDVKLENSSVKLEVTSPSGNIKKYSNGYNNGSISFVPMEGQGNYKVEADFTGADKNGQEVKRHFLRSVLVGEFQPGYIGMIERKMGNYIYTSQGLLTQNRAGITVEIFRKGSGMQNPIGKGYVTEVSDTSCTIKLQEIYGTVEDGDIVILNLLQWKGDN